MTEEADEQRDDLDSGIEGAIIEERAGEGLSLDRRDFLRLGAVGATGAALLRPSLAMASNDASAAGNVPIMEGVAPFTVHVTEEVTFVEACKTCSPSPADPAPLGRIDYDTEVAMSQVWAAFARGFEGTASPDIYWSAIRIGIENARGVVYDEMSALPEQDRLKVWTGTKLPGHAKKWRELGTKAGTAAKGTRIRPKHFQQAWSQVFGASKKTQDLGGLQDRAAELIGAHLWIHFTLGTIAHQGNAALPFSYDAVEAGRRRSRYFIHNSVAARGVYDSTWDAIDYSLWAWANNAKCAVLTGHRASKCAVKRGASAIEAQDVETGWCLVANGISALRTKMAARGVSILADGCSG